MLPTLPAHVLKLVAQNGQPYFLYPDGQTHALELTGIQDEAMIHDEFLLQARDFFFQYLPASKIDLQLDSAIQSNPLWLKMVKEIASVLGHTNHAMQQLSARQSEFKNHSGVLFYCPDDFQPLQRICEDMKLVEPHHQIHLHFFKTGWLVKERRWTPSQAPSLQELLETCSRHKIGSIISSNYYWLQHHRVHNQLFMPALLEFLGLRYVGIDFDSYEMTGFRGKHQFIGKNSEHFSSMSNVHKPWDLLYGNSKIEYISPTYFPSKEIVGDRHSRKAPSNTEAIVISHSRVLQTLDSLPICMALVEAFDPESLFQDFQTWYYALKHELLMTSQISRSLRELYISRLSGLYLELNSFLKFYVIEEAAQCIPVKIYGDNAWADVFPEQFTGQYLSAAETQARLQQVGCMRLTMNDNFSYLENNPVFSSSLQSGVDFLHFAAVVTAPDWEGFRGASYQSISELRSKITHASDICRSDRFQETRKQYIETSQSYTRGLSDRLFGRPSAALFHYQQATQRDYEAFELTIPAFRRKYPDLANNQMREFLLNDLVPLELPRNSWFQKPFVQRLHRLREQLMMERGLRGTQTDSRKTSLDLQSS